MPIKKPYTHDLDRLITLRKYNSLTSLDRFRNIERDRLFNSHRNSSENLIEIRKMSDFDLNSTSRIDRFDGEGEKSEVKLRDFLSEIKFRESLLKPEAKTQFISYIITCKITGKAKTKIGQKEIKTITDLERELKNACLGGTTAKYVEAQLATAKQGSKTVPQFADMLSELAEKLGSLLIKEHNAEGEPERKILQKIANDKAITAFKTGVHRDLKILLETKKPDNVNEALKVILDTDLVSEANADQINFFGNNTQVVSNKNQKTHNNSHNYRPKYNYNRDQPQRSNNFRGRISYNNAPTRPNFRTNNNFRNNNNNNHNNRNNNNNRGQFRRNYPNNRIYFSNENPQYENNSGNYPNNSNYLPEENPQYDNNSGNFQGPNIHTT
jgi:hypothetical protein